MSFHFDFDAVKTLPALNAGALRAAIVIILPVCGLQPLRAARSQTSNLPKPSKKASLPLAKILYSFTN